MAANLARAGFKVTGWNRTAERARESAERGVVLAVSPAAAVSEVDIVVICVSDTPDVEAVLFGPDGVVAGARPGTLVIDCSTIAPSGSWDFAARLRERDIAMIDAPVSGGSEGAQKATLTIFVGGDARRRRARPSGPRRDGSDDHPRRADRRRPGSQGRQPGHPRRRVPRRGGGDRPRHQGRARRRAGRRRRSAVGRPRAGSSRTAAAG